MALIKSRRERNILVATVVIAVGAVIFRFAPDIGAVSLSDLRGQLDEAQQQYEVYKKGLSRRDEIQNRRDELEKKGIRNRTDQDIIQIIEREFRSLGLTPDLRTPDFEFLYEGATDYGRITLTIFSRGTIEQVGRMLKLFDQQGIQVNELKLTSQLDTNLITIEVTIMQPIKLTDDMKEKLKSERKTRDGRQTRPYTPGAI
jgi:hypothetical protein